MLYVPDEAKIEKVVALLISQFTEQSSKPYKPPPKQISSIMEILAFNPRTRDKVRLSSSQVLLLINIFLSLPQIGSILSHQNRLKRFRALLVGAPRQLACLQPSADPHRNIESLPSASRTANQSIKIQHQKTFHHLRL